MDGREVFERQREQHRQLRQWLRDWLVELETAATGRAAQLDAALGSLRELYRVWEREVPHHFREEEAVLYALAEARRPRLRALLGELRGEHDELRHGFEAFRQALVLGRAAESIDRMVRLGRELARRLEAHIDREERELHPVLLAEFSEEDWQALRSLLVDSLLA